jgi:hypothetical protein
MKSVVPTAAQTKEAEKTAMNLERMKARILGNVADGKGALLAELDKMHEAGVKMVLIVGHSIKPVHEADLGGRVVKLVASSEGW